MNLFCVWFVEYPEDGSYLVEAENELAACKLFAKEEEIEEGTELAATRLTLEALGQRLENEADEQWNGAVPRSLHRPRVPRPARVLRGPGSR